MDELEDFKSNINLSEYAAAQGYAMDRKASSKNSVVIRSPDGDKIVIARGTDQHWIYFSVRDDNDNGTIIDFVQKRKHVKLGGARQELRPWIGGVRAVTRPNPDLFAQEIAPITKDRALVLLELARMKPLLTHAYLDEERGLAASLLRSPRCIDRVLVDHRSNAVFPHRDQDGPCAGDLKRSSPMADQTPAATRNKRVLFVCHLGRMRSRTAVHVFAPIDWIETDFAGIGEEAVRPVSTELVA